MRINLVIKVSYFGYSPSDYPATPATNSVHTAMVKAACY